MLEEDIKNINAFEIANNMYYQWEDMDWLDYEEGKEESIETLTNSIEWLKELASQGDIKAINLLIIFERVFKEV